MVLLNKLFIRLGFTIIAIITPIHAFADIVWEEWVAVFDGPYGYRAESTDIAVDGDGNVYVTGFTRTEAHNESNDYCTIKYDSEGNELWFATYDGPGDRSDDNDGAFAITLDNDYNVYVTGALDGGHDFWYSECCTIKYDTDGNEIWIRTFGGFDVWGNDIAIDNEGNVYVAGTAYAWGTQSDVFLIKYDGDGNELWFARHDGPESGSDGGTALILDGYGNIYVTGYIEDDPGYSNSYCTIKYNSDGEELWVAYYNPGTDWTAALDIGLDGNGNVFVTGGNIPQNAATVKYDNDGNEIWAITYDYDSMWHNYLDIETSGNIYVTGTTSDGSDANYKTIKYDNDGNEIWVREYNGPSEGADRPRSVAVDNSGGIYVGGYSRIIGDPDCCCVVKYDTEGNVRWVARSETSASYNFGGMATDAPVDNVHIYTTGYDTHPNGDIYTIKYAQLSNEPPGDFNLTAPPDGSTVTEPVTLDWEDSTDDDGDTVTYDVWYATDPSFDPHDEVTELTESTYAFPEGVLSDGTTYYWKVLAWDGYEGTWSGPDPYWSFTVEDEVTDIPVTSFSAESARNGVKLTWECADPGVGFNLYRSEEATGVRSKLREMLNAELITGESPFSYLDAEVSDGVTYSYWLEAMDAGGTSETFGPVSCTAGTFVPGSYALYQSRPNPARGTTVIAFDLPEDADVTLTVYDLSGRKVTTLVNETLPAGAHERPVAGLAPGVYVYRLVAVEFSGVKKMVVID